MGENLRTASLRSEFTGSFKKSVDSLACNVTVIYAGKPNAQA